MAQKKEPRKGLGRGLSALMADVESAESKQSSQSAGAGEIEVPIERIKPNPDQPRRYFAEEHLAELAESLKTKGVLQPLIVRSDPDEPGTYQIVAGERRWRAAQLARLHNLPVIVREFDDSEVLEIAIIENIQREDLSAIEEATGYRQLMDSFGHTQEKLSEALGKSRSHIANLLRLLTLPKSIQDYVNKGEISAGHARALIGAPNAETLAHRVIAEGLSVRETEKLVKNIGGQSKTRSPSARTSESKDADTRALEADLSAALGMKVSISHTAGSENGVVTISYADLDQLDILCGRLTA